MKSKKLHFYHSNGRRIGDLMPYFDNGILHYFYLLNGSGHNNINHEHAISGDLINFCQLQPSIIRDNIGYSGIDNGCIFTGCYLKDSKGIYHCFYTSWNPNNPNGREFIRHAISDDLINFEKLPMILGPDPRYYSVSRFRDFRDPCVFFDNDSGYYHMFILANKKDNNNDANSWDQNWITGHYKSINLFDWEALPPLEFGLNDECPDYFQLNGKHYLHGCKKYVVSDSVFGPYRSLDHQHMDLPTLRAAKTCFDGKRRLWFGGFGGGTFNLPREIVQHDDFSLGLKLVEEIYEQFAMKDNEVTVYMNNIIDKTTLFQIESRIDKLELECYPSGTVVEIDLTNNSVLVTQIDGFSFSRKIRKVNPKNKVDLIIEDNIVEIYINELEAIFINTIENIKRISIKSAIKEMVIKTGYFN